VNDLLVRLQDTELTLADPADDVRGRKVVDRNGDEIGDIDGLIVDEKERRVRFLEVGSGEPERATQLVPVDVIGGVDDRVVHISPDRIKVAGGPVLDRDVVPERPYYASLYSYYECPPFWWPGYSYPRLRH
jgi:sporulation protein YlmC with PRC-barrel domain